MLNFQDISLVKTSIERGKSLLSNHILFEILKRFKDCQNSLGKRRKTNNKKKSKEYKIK